ERDEFLVDVDQPVLEEPGVAGLAVGVDRVGVLGPGVVHERRPVVALDAGPGLAVLGGQPGLPDVRGLHHVVIDADDLGQLHASSASSPLGVPARHTLASTITYRMPYLTPPSRYRSAVSPSC